MTDFLARHGLTLLSPPAFQGITIGGAIATATHGTGLHTSSLSDDVVAMTLIDASGRRVEIREDDGDRFHAAQIALGTLGVVYDVTLRCAPAFRVLIEHRQLPREEVLYAIDDLVASYPFVEIYWPPGARHFLCKMMRHTDDALDPPLKRWLARGEDAVTHPIIEWLMPRLSRGWPTVIPPMVAGMMPLLSAFRHRERVGSTIDAFHYHRAYPRCISMSFGVPIADTRAAWQTAIDLVESEARAGRHPVNMVSHARFIGASAAFPSPAYGRATCDLEVVTARGTPDSDRFYADWCGEMLALPEARPHWGKHILQPERIRARYPAIDNFLAVRAELDPMRVFLNDCLEHSVFQLGSA